MKTLCTLALICGLANGSFSQMNYYQKSDNYTFEYVPAELAGNMQPGQGIRVTDDIEYAPATYSPFLHEPLETKGLQPEAISTAAIVNARFYISDNLTTEAKARSYYTNFKNVLGLQSGKMAYERAFAEQSNSKTMQIVMEAKKPGPSLGDDKKVWVKHSSYQTMLQNIENTANPAEQSDEFLKIFGSHFIMSVQTGYRIEILATIHSKDSAEQSKFQAGIAEWVAKMNAGSAYTGSFNPKNTEIFCKISSGNIEPRMASTIIGFDEINNFITSLKQGKYTLYTGAIGAYVQSYKGTLLDYPKISNMFKSNIVLSQHSGLPAGSVIAWSPRPEDIVNGVITPPSGWAVCNGENNTPDLCNRFIKGVNKNQTDLYSSTVSNEGNTTSAGKASGSQFLSLVYIIKLE